MDLWQLQQFPRPFHVLLASSAVARALHVFLETAAVPQGTSCTYGNCSSPPGHFMDLCQVQHSYGALHIPETNEPVTRGTSCTCGNWSSLPTGNFMNLWQLKQSPSGNLMTWGNWSSLPQGTSCTSGHRVLRDFGVPAVFFTHRVMCSCIGAPVEFSLRIILLSLKDVKYSYLKHNLIYFLYWFPWPS